MPAMDFGDLPEPNLPGPAAAVAWKVTAANAARHFINPKLRLGALIDGELDGEPTELTDGDDTDVDGDDEDGTFLAAIGPSDDALDTTSHGEGETTFYNVGVTVLNDTGEDAALVGYIDFNCDGVFSEPGDEPAGDAVERARVIVDGDGTITAGECAIANVNNTGTTNQVCGLQWGLFGSTTPLIRFDDVANCGTTTDGKQRTYARFRLTTEPEFFTDASPRPNNRARDGEVEDYNIIVAASSTPAIVTDVAAHAAIGGGAVVSFSTGTEMGSLAFRLERLVGQPGEPGSHWTKVIKDWIPSPMEVQGADYKVLDSAASAGEVHFYRIIEKSLGGGQEVYGPFEVAVSSDVVEWAEAQPYSAEVHFDYERVAENLETREQAKNAGQGGGKGGGKGGSGDAPDTLRVLVEETGIYGFSVQELADAFETDTSQISNLIRRGQLRLTAGGEDVPWYEYNDVFYFYGQAPNHVYSKTRTYWLYLKQTGAFMNVQDVDPPTGTPPETFAAEGDFEEDHLAALIMQPEDPDMDFWVWRKLLSNGAPSTTFTLEVPGAVPQAGKLSLRLWPTDDVEHVLAVSANDKPLGTLHLFGTLQQTLDLDIPADAFNGDTMQLSLTLLNSPAGVDTALYVDGFTVAWTRNYHAHEVDDLIEYPAQGPVLLKEFNSDALLTVNITDPQAPVWVDGGEVTPEGDQFSWSAGLKSGRYLTVSLNSYLSPNFVGLDTKSNLASTNNRADYVIISHAELMEAAEALADYRSADFVTMVVDIQDIYDEFTDGEPFPLAMQEFAKASQSWKKAPRYFVILGDGSVDYRDVYGTGYNFISPQLWGGFKGVYPSDTLLGDLTGDGVPEIAFGRIPIRNVADGLTYVQKISRYEADSEYRKTLLLSDNNDRGGDFGFSSLQIAREVAGNSFQIGLEGREISDVRTELQTEIARGLGLINYIGHGSYFGLAAEGLISWSDVPDMENEVTPGLVALTCLVNNFHIPGLDSLGEDLVLHADGGMVFSWAAAGHSFNEEATALGMQFQAEFGSFERLGDAIIATFKGTPYLVPVYTLIGDPALRLGN
jgi:hypothetical protein